jgi:rsbT co-antagonist protein RsbR
VSQTEIPAPIEKLEEQVRRKKRELETKKRLRAMIFDEAPDGVIVLSPDGTSVINSSGEKMFGTQQENPDPNWQQTWGFFDLTSDKRLEPYELGTVRCMMGEATAYDELRLRPPGREDELFVSSISVRLPDGKALTVTQDVAARVAAEREVGRQSDALAKRAQENGTLVGRLRAALDELATPVLRVASGVLVMPLIGVLDGDRAAHVGERLLSEIVRSRARFVIIDVTGVGVLDTTTADHLARVARAVGLLGARCLLSGVQPEVAQTLVALGVGLSGLTPHKNLAHALAACMAAAPAKTPARKEQRA